MPMGLLTGGSKLCWNFWVMTSLMSNPLPGSEMGGELDSLVTGGDTRRLDESIELLLLKISQPFLLDEDVVGLKDGILSITFEGDSAGSGSTSDGFST